MPEISGAASCRSCAGITARAGFHGFYIYCNYGLTDLFKYGKGPAVSPMTIGLGFGF